MKLSVALCTYNGEKYLLKQLESIFNQSYPINEIVISDDASADGTLKIIKDFQITHPGNVLLYCNDNKLGAKKNFAKAISKCTGDIIFLSDQDDIWYFNKVEETIKKFEKEPNLELVFSNGILIDDNDNPLLKTLFSNFGFTPQIQYGWKTKGATEYILAGKNQITGATVAIKKSLFLRSQPFDLPETVWHDAWLGLHAAIENKLGWINQPLIKYRVHTNQQVGIIEKQYSNINSLRSLLELVQTVETDLLCIANLLLSAYQHERLRVIKQQKIHLLSLLQFRLNLPYERVKRGWMVIKNTHLYFRAPYLTVKSVLIDILRDIIKPV